MIRCSNKTNVRTDIKTDRAYKKKIIPLMPVILKQRMENKRSLMEFCGVIRDLIIVSFGSKVMVMWLNWRQKRVEAVLLTL